MTKTVIINGKPYPFKQAVEMWLNTVAALDSKWLPTREHRSG
jgi:hypothetical protein